MQKTYDFELTASVGNIVGLLLTGAKVTGEAVAGAAVTGAKVAGTITAVGAKLTGAAVVGAAAVGAVEIGADVAGAFVLIVTTSVGAGVIIVEIVVGGCRYCHEFENTYICIHKFAKKHMSKHRINATHHMHM